jgi:hypothetical protein
MINEEKSPCWSRATPMSAVREVDEREEETNEPSQKVRRKSDANVMYNFM